MAYKVKKLNITSKYNTLFFNVQFGIFSNNVDVWIIVHRGVVKNSNVPQIKIAIRNLVREINEKTIN